MVGFGIYRARMHGAGVAGVNVHEVTQKHRIPTARTRVVAMHETTQVTQQRDARVMPVKAPSPVLLVTLGSTCNRCSCPVPSCGFERQDKCAMICATTCGSLHIVFYAVPEVGAGRITSIGCSWSFLASTVVHYLNIVCVPTVASLY